jgi:hypothetical protein
MGRYEWLTGELHSVINQVGGKWSSRTEYSVVSSKMRNPSRGKIGEATGCGGISIDP